MNDVYTKFRDYLDVKPDENRPSVAYFSMEYGLSSVLKYIPVVWVYWLATT